ncbi:MAG: alpha/beta hydrolase [Gemmatimonadales bacterium]|jgi:pimeloyl-ACP methyl ester carboxylesterase|nr:MAG: alpha/beta hydrolase [Gemmatimonadales bacterium]
MRSVLATVVLIALVPLATLAQAAGPPEPVVVVHGAWGGGWDWKGVEGELRARGRDVYRATLTGQGERHHLASPEIGLETHIRDVVNLIVWEQLEDVVLVGHSYGGMVITGVADRIPDRIGKLVYLDAMLPFDGECVVSIMGAREGECGDVSSLQGQSGGFIAPGWVQPDAVPPYDVPHPARTLVDPLTLEGAPGEGKPALYIVTREAPGQPDGFDWAAERAAQLGWPVEELVADHNPQRTHPSEVADLILGRR